MRRRRNITPRCSKPVAEQDDELMEKYLGGEELTQDEIVATIRKATIANKMVPVTCGTSYQQQGRAEAARRYCSVHAGPD